MKHYMVIFWQEIHQVQTLNLMELASVIISLMRTVCSSLNQRGKAICEAIPTLTLMVVQAREPRIWSRATTEKFKTFWLNKEVFMRKTMLFSKRTSPSLRITRHWKKCYINRNSGTPTVWRWTTLFFLTSTKRSSKNCCWRLITKR